MKLRIEIADDMPDEVIIRAKTSDERVKRLQQAFKQALYGGSELAMSIGNTEYFVPVSDILFFETDNGSVTAHTAENMYISDSKLYELERALPSSFVRVSKSCVLNSASVASVTRTLTGSGEVLFKNSRKKAYVSRMYCKNLIDLIYEMRILK